MNTLNKLSPRYQKLLNENREGLITTDCSTCGGTGIETFKNGDSEPCWLCQGKGYRTFEATICHVCLLDGCYYCKGVGYFEYLGDEEEDPEEEKWEAIALAEAEAWWEHKVSNGVTIERLDQAF